MTRPPSTRDQGPGGVGLLDPPRRGSAQERRADSGGPPPGDGGGGGNGGGNGGNGDGGGPQGAPDGRAGLAFGLLLISISTLFAAFLGAWLVLRRTAVTWPPPGTPRPPQALWLSTLLLAATSATLARASLLRQRGRLSPMRALLRAATTLGFAFLLVQGILWRGLVVDGLSIATNAYGMVFYSLTGLHAAHVVGGIAYLVVASVRTSGVAAARAGWTPVEFCAAYWHFLGVLWLFLFAVLYLPR